jgi:hypothetical protein
MPIEIGLRVCLAAVNRLRYPPSGLPLGRRVNLSGTWRR